MGVDKKRLSFQTRTIIFLVVVLIAIATSFYLYAQTVKQAKEKYDTGVINLEILEREQNRCEDLLVQESGVFNDYEYCQKLLKTFPKQ